MRERTWAIEVRPYIQVGDSYISESDIAVIRGLPTGESGLPGTLTGNGLGELEVPVATGHWVEWARSYSYQELKSLMLDVIAEFGASNVRIVEIQNVSIAVLPNA